MSVGIAVFELQALEKPTDGHAEDFRQFEQPMRTNSAQPPLVLVDLL